MANFKAGDHVRVISDGRVGQIKNVRGHITNANMPGAVEEVDDCLVAFGNDITKAEWFKPDQLQHSEPKQNRVMARPVDPRDKHVPKKA